jgi:hypothetical protein
MDEQTFNNLRQRLGDEHLGKRMRAQVDHIINVTGQGLGSFHYENVSLFTRFVDLSLRISGLKKYGQQHALQFVVHEIVYLFPACQSHSTDYGSSNYLTFTSMAIRAWAAV